MFFNQAMDRASVEGAISGQPNLSGGFQWTSDAVLAFTPDQPFLPDTYLTLSISQSARSLKGLPLVNPLTLDFRTTGYLRPAQRLPEPDTENVNVTSAVVVTFNRAVVSLVLRQVLSPDRLCLRHSAFPHRPQAKGAG